jgi:hypothetical protein
MAGVLPPSVLDAARHGYDRECRKAGCDIAGTSAEAINRALRLLQAAVRRLMWRQMFHLFTQYRALEQGLLHVS